MSCQKPTHPLVDIQCSARAVLSCCQEVTLVPEIEWNPLPALWPSPAEFADIGGCMLLVFTQDSVPTWEVHRRSKTDNNEIDLIVSGTADTFEAAKAAARFEASAHKNSVVK
jgi:hypothetical protein